MSLGNLKVPTFMVRVSDEDSFPVRGLSVRDIGMLASKHHAMLSSLFAEIALAQGTGEARMDTVENMLPQLLQRAPDLVADAVSVAHDGSLENSEVIAVLPLPVVVEAISEIFKLTFRTEGELKKVIETVIQGLQGTTKQLEGLSS